MLNLIEKYIGGSVRVIGTNKFVIWVVNDRKQIINILKIFDSYPPLTSRLQAQIAFMKECLDKNNIEWYLLERNNKYNNFISIKFYIIFFYNSLKISLILPNHTLFLFINVMIIVILNKFSLKNPFLISYNIIEIFWTKLSIFLFLNIK